MPVLLKIMDRSYGDVLELGSGLFSTPVLHWICTSTKRKLVSLENNPRIYGWIKNFENEFHSVRFVEKWEDASVDGPWSVALVDHNPAIRRVEEIKRLKDTTNFLIVHDAEGRHDRTYKYSTILPLFTYRFYCAEFYPHTLVLSNLNNLEWLK